MYAKVKTVRRGGRRYEYLELVEGRREGTRVRQHVVANLGRLDELKAGGKLEQLVARLARLDQPPPGSRPHVGPLLVAAPYLPRLWAADRTIGRPVKTLQASVPAGVARYLRPHKGSASELPAFMAALEALAAALPPGLVVVAGSGLGYTENLCAADAANLRFVVPLRAGTGWPDRFTPHVPAGLAALQVLDPASSPRPHPPRAPP